MGNDFGKPTVYFTRVEEARRRKDISELISDPLDEGPGHSDCYVRPNSTRLYSSKFHSKKQPPSVPYPVPSPVPTQVIVSAAMCLVSDKTGCSNLTYAASQTQ
ncbi:unnamed protein product, partial [Dovyalis caffra]